MAENGDRNAPKTRGIANSARKPGRLDQFADSVNRTDEETATELGVPNRNETQSLRKSDKTKDRPE